MRPSLPYPNFSEIFPKTQKSLKNSPKRYFNPLRIKNPGAFGRLLEIFA